jgi:TPR repeat protein
MSKHVIHTLVLGWFISLGLWSDEAAAKRSVNSNEALTFSKVAPLHHPYNKRIRTNLAKLEKMCQSGDGNACYTLGRAMLEHRDVVDTSVLKYYAAACSAGSAFGCYEQGRLVMQSGGVPKADEAILLFSKGCDGGAAKACYSKADLLTDGKLLPQDLRLRTH